MYILIDRYGASFRLRNDLYIVSGGALNSTHSLIMEPHLSRNLQWYCFYTLQTNVKNNCNCYLFDECYSVNRFCNVITSVIILSLKIPPHLKCVATLPRKMSMF